MRLFWSLFAVLLLAATPALAAPDVPALWVGCLSEQPRPGSHLGALGSEILIDQFVALRAGDRFWYTRVLSRREIAEVEGTRLSAIIRRNTRIGRELPRDVFSPARRTHRPRPWRRPAPPRSGQR